MSLSGNGVNSKSSNAAKKFAGCVKKPVSVNKSRDKIFPLEEFRGFAKLPVVFLSRYNITPYLKPVVLCDKGPRLDINRHSERLTKTCVVRVAKNDLEKLIPHSNASTDSVSSDSDIEIDINMASKCNICEKLYSTDKKLLKHQTRKHQIVKKSQKRVSFSDHVIIHELKEYHKCRKCTKIFEHYRSLKSHMKRFHKKRKCYICYYCNRRFVDRLFFKLHIKSHCDVCGQFFSRRVDYLVHKRHCRVFKLQKCKDCDSSFFTFMHLKDHSYVHSNMFYVCDVCKDQFLSKCALAHHISFLHSKQRPSSLYAMRNLGSERLYLCNFCDETSVDRDLIEGHIQTLPDLSNKAMTGYKDYYFCDQCMKKFDTETVMLQHKWTHFLKTSDNSQIRMDCENKGDLGKTTYKSDEKLPEMMNPKVLLEKLDLSNDLEDTKNHLINKCLLNECKKKAIVDPKSKKTLISNYQCQTCDKYYSSNYCLNRHIETMHSDYETLRCHVCEETFVWPSLLKSHKCLRLNNSEMPFDDTRPEIHFDTIHQITQNGLDDFNIGENDDYLNSVDFEIPAPIVELTEKEGSYTPNDYVSENVSPVEKTFIPPLEKSFVVPLQNLGYKLIMQEVPIEF